MTDSNSPQWISDPRAIYTAVIEAKRAGRRVGLVPTMGNLHEGHLSLVRRAKAECDLVVVTIFVNPIQFAAGEDFDRYPRTPEEDGQLCAQEGVDFIFAPTTETMYPPGSCTRVQVTGLEEPLCGQNRPGHFVGVATVVAKLFNLVPADIAYFGRKDYQQATLLKRMAADLNFPIELVLCPTIREEDGLARSSRNAYLTPEQRTQAPVLYRALQLAQDLVGQGERSAAVVRQKMVDLISNQPLAQIDYVELVDPETLQPVTDLDRPTLAAVAVRFGNARLIDNDTLDPKRT